MIESVLVFLAATIIAVPLFKKLKLGAILGYLLAGVVIGPSVANLVGEPETILHFAEMGVVLMLFVIGLELEPRKLWQMRGQILMSGGGQLLITSAIIAGGLLLVAPLSLSQTIVVGLALALSSTAFAIQLMTEQNILRTAPGQQGFSILLMQDVAVIPILVLISALAPGEAGEGIHWGVGILAILAILAIGRYLINPVLRFVSRYGSTEVMTASALFIVLLTAVTMEHVGFSMGMGAFIAGILLADSSFKHQLETEIEPFKGLLLGLFFIAIGMNLDLALLVNQPLLVISGALLLVLLKTVVIGTIIRMSKQSWTDANRVALMLSQGGEFAFVVMTMAASSSLLDEATAGLINLIVGISMAMTSPLVILYSMKFNSKQCPAVYDSNIDVSEPSVLIAGFGRFGQISARLLAANNTTFSAIDIDASHIEFVRKFGNKVFFGDATRLDLLKKAGVEDCRVVLAAMDDQDAVTKLVKLLKANFPHIIIIARAKDRIHARELGHLGVDFFIRETFDSALVAAKEVLRGVGYSDGQVDYMADAFYDNDNNFLKQSIEDDMSFEAIVETSQQRREELKRLFTEEVQK